MRISVPALLVAALMTAAVPALAQEKAEKPAMKAPAKETSLKPGDAAPALSVAKWLKGEPVTSFEKGKVYVVEFWATWCGPCIASMPHLSELQKEYKGKVTIIGVTSEDPRNTLEKAQKMVADKGDTMGYTVAWDNERATNTAYMTAAGQGGIPCSFVIDKQGKVAYIGHPMNLDLVLENVVAGTWDTKADNAFLAEVQKGMKDLDDAEGAKALEKLDQLSAKNTRLAPLLAQSYNQVAWGIVDPQAKNDKPDTATALKAAEQAAKLSKNKDAAILDTLARVYWVKGDKPMAIETQTKAVAAAPEAMKKELQKTLDEYKTGK